MCTISLRTILLFGLMIPALTGILFPSTAAAMDTGRVNKRIVKSVDKHFDRIPARTAQKAIEKYDHLITYFSSLYYTRTKHKVDGDYIRALICVESNGNPKAISSAKARGLTQILTTTGRQWAKTLHKTKFDFKYIDEKRLKNLQAKDLFDPAINILLACFGTDLYNRKYDGNIALVGSAWNAGVGAVKKYDDSPPYRETVNFVGRINAYMQYFRKNRQSASRQTSRPKNTRRN